MLAVALLLVVAASQVLAAPQTSFVYPGRSFQQDAAGQFSNNEVSYTGAVMQEQGVLKTAADGTLVLVKKGNFQYMSPEGVPVRIDYTADEFGFHPVGSVIPVAPAPQQVQRF